jgi:hypothetical protein
VPLSYNYYLPVSLAWWLPMRRMPVAGRLAESYSNRQERHCLAQLNSGNDNGAVASPYQELYMTPYRHNIIFIHLSSVVLSCAYDLFFGAGTLLSCFFPARRKVGD